MTIASLNNCPWLAYTRTEKPCTKCMFRFDCLVKKDRIEYNSNPAQWKVVKINQCPWISYRIKIKSCEKCALANSCMVKEERKLMNERST